MDNENIMNREFQFSEYQKLNDYLNDSNLKKVLCSHCKRTKINGLSCIGKCVADNEY